MSTVFLRRLIPPKTKEIIPFSKLIKRFEDSSMNGNQYFTLCNQSKYVRD